MSTDLTTQAAASVAEPRPRREAPQVLDPIPVLDTARFEHMQRIANVMVYSSLLPETLTHVGTKDAKERLPLDTIKANAFLVTNQAVRWGMDPFAVAQCVSVVHGRLCYEGKLVAGVLDAKLGVKLHHWFVGTGEATRVYVSDTPFTEDHIARLSPGVQLLGVRMIDGSVAEWKTTGANSPWAPKNYQRQLRYRGTREWARAFEPALLLGVYTQDEMAGLQARDVTPPRPRLTERLAAARSGTALPAPTDGFDPRFIAGELAGPARQDHAADEPVADDLAEAQSVHDEDPAPDAGAVKESVTTADADDANDDAPPPDPNEMLALYRSDLADCETVADVESLDERWVASLEAAGIWGRAKLARGRRLTDLAGRKA